MSIIKTYSKKFKRVTPLLVVAVILFGLIGSYLATGNSKVQAANFQQAYVRLDHLTGTTITGGRVCIKPATVGVEGKIVLVFPTTAATDYALNGTAATWTANQTFETGFTSGAITFGASGVPTVSGHTVTYTISTDLVVGTLYCFNFGAGLTTSSAGAAVSAFGYVETQTAAAAQIDKTFWGTTIISGETVAISAYVAPTFTLALSGTTDAFSTNGLLVGSVNASTSNRFFQVDTNGANGWIVWAKGTNSKTVSDTGSTNLHGALTSATASYQISNNTVNALNTPNASHVFSSGSEDYGLAVTLNTNGTGGGTPTMNAAYDGATANAAGVIDPTQYRPIASSAGYAIGDKVNITMLATISANTPPATDYADTMYYVGAGQF